MKGRALCRHATCLDRYLDELAAVEEEGEGCGEPEVVYEYDPYITYDLPIDKHCPDEDIHDDLSSSNVHVLHIVFYPTIQLE